MNHKSYVSFTTIHRLTPIVVALITFIIFYSTMAPTVSFWDCGEYISAAYTLGINHPPGNPLYVLVGRIFTIILFGMQQISARVNLFSVISGAVTAFFVYKIITTIVSDFIGEADTFWKKQTLITAGVVGAFFSVLNDTYWASAVEASVYPPSILMLVISFYLVLRWAKSTEESRDRFLICAVYTTFLGVGFHLFAILAFPPLFLFVIIADRGKRRDLCFWLTMFILSSVAFAASTFIHVAPVLLFVCGVYRFVKKPFAMLINLFLAGAALFLSWKAPGGSLISTAPFIALLLIVFGDLFYSKNNPDRKKRWHFLFLLTLFAVLGFSVYLSIPIRSKLQPVIDYGHPVVHWEQGKIASKSFDRHLDRSEYIAESMLTRMLHRRGAFFSQFGFDDKLGYLGFHLTQFFHFGNSIARDRGAAKENIMLGGSNLKRLVYTCIYLLPTGFMLWGIFFWGKAAKKTTLLLISMFLLSSLGMVVYLNFSDGTQLSKQNQAGWKLAQEQASVRPEKTIEKPSPIPREVRCRDYFFTGAFLFFGIWIGLATAALLIKMADSKKAAIRKAGMVCSVLLIALPLIPFLSNYKENNRSGNWRTYDYAYNLLMSCETNSILFVDGDDMLAFWALQEAEGIRKDVSVISFALLKRQWYLPQLMHKTPRVPISLSEEEIETGLRVISNQSVKEQMIRLPKSGLEISLPDKHKKKRLLVQDQLFLGIVDETNFSRPIYFPLSVRADYLMGLWRYLKIEGMVYKLVKQPVKEGVSININMERSKHLLTNVYHYRNRDKRSVVRSEIEQIIVQNMGASYIFYCQSLNNRIKGALNTRRQYQAILDSRKLTNTKEIDREIEGLNRYIQDSRLEINTLFKRCLAVMPGNVNVRRAYHMFLAENKP